jgi:hypothetical protein
LLEAGISDIAKLNEEYSPLGYTDVSFEKRLTFWRSILVHLQVRRVSQVGNQWKQASSSKLHAVPATVGTS